MTKTPQTAPPRKRDAEATSARIIAAAQDLFSRYGYDGVSTRDIAATAGVNVALINRYFGSKAGLFEEAIVTSMEKVDASPDALATLGQAKAEWLARPRTEGFDPMTTLLRSSMSPEVRDIIRRAVREKGVDLVAGTLGGEDREIRAHLLVATIAGLDLWLHMLDGTEGCALNRERLAERIAALVDGIVADGDPRD